MERASGTREVRVATLNLWGHHGAWDERRSVLVDGLRELQPDIVAFQEAVVTDAYDQVADLLGASYYVAHQAGREADGTGLSIASHWEGGRCGRRPCTSPPRSDPSQLAVAEIRAPDPIGTLLFAHHNPSWQLGFEHERALQAVAASRLVEDLLVKREVVSHVVLAGDFNAAPDSTSVRFWRGLQSLDGVSVCYRDAWESTHPGDPDHIFTPRNLLVADPDWPFRRLDYTFVRRGEHGGPTLQISACELIIAE